MIQHHKHKNLIKEIEYKNYYCIIVKFYYFKEGILNA